MLDLQLYSIDKQYKNYIVPVKKTEDSFNTKIKNNRIKKLLSTISKDELKEKEIKKFSVFEKGELHNIYLIVAPEVIDLFDFAEAGKKIIGMIDEKELTSICYYDFESVYNLKRDIRLTKAFLEGVLYGSYKFETYKSEKKQCSEISISVPERVYTNLKNSNFIAETNMIFKYIFIAKDLINMPPNELTPGSFAEIISKNENDNLKVEIFDHNDIKKMGLNLIDAVGKGSEHKPYLVKLTYIGLPDSDKKIALIGKGVTFDSGGTNLKPTGSIETMKSDMAGAATVFGLMMAIAENKLPVNVTAFLPLVENTIGTYASRPGDIIKSYSGKTVEILNTDAEGRLILADAITLATKENPSLIIDIATLTGACVVALGSYIAGFFSNNDEYAKKLEETFKNSYEDLHRFPLYLKYKERIKSKVADLQNISKKRTEAGTIMGALFLHEFVEKYPWIHIDIAGPAFMDDCHPLYGEGGSAYGFRSLYLFIKNGY